MSHLLPDSTGRIVRFEDEGAGSRRAPEGWEDGISSATGEGGQWQFERRRRVPEEDMNDDFKQTGDEPDDTTTARSSWASTIGVCLETKCRGTVGQARIDCTNKCYGF